MKCGKALILTFVTVGLSGCVNYAGIEQARLGITVDELVTMDTPCYYGGQSEGRITYHCRFSVPTSPGSNNRTIKPYIMKFENNSLSEIILDQNALIREEMREQFYFQHQFYYPHGHFRAGYPYYP